MPEQEIEYIFSPQQEQEIVNCIRQAESKTSGEIRVHIDKECSQNQLNRAVEVFYQLNMHNTQQRNAVLFHITIKERGFAIYGDIGIDQATPDDFWENIKNHITTQFKQGNYTQGLKQGIAMAAEQLQLYFPVQNNNPNELPNDISKT